MRSTTVRRRVTCGTQKWVALPCKRGLAGSRQSHDEDFARHPTDLVAGVIGVDPDVFGHDTHPTFRPRGAIDSESASPTRRTTLPQSPGLGWRNNRAVGYQ